MRIAAWILGIVALVAAALGLVYLYGEQRFAAGEAKCEAAHTKAAEDVRKVIDQNTRTAAETNTSTQSWLWSELPPIDLCTSEARERVRTVYREAPPIPVADRCSAPARPARVQSELAEARARVIAAGTGSAVRTGTDDGAATDPGLHHGAVVGVRGAHGRMGDRGARPDRERSEEGPRIADLRAGPP